MTSHSATPVPTYTSASAPVAVRLGDGRAPRTAAVLAPVMGQWDRGAFLAPVAQALTAEYRVTVYDTLSLLRDGDDLTALAARWADVLGADDPDLLVGNALGGAVVQHLLGRPWTRRARVVLLSAPTVADGPLDAALERVAAAVSSHGTATAVRLLHEVVRGPDDIPAPQATAATEGSDPLGDDPSAGRRLADGLRLLRGADARQHVEAFPGNLLHVYGTESRLVQRRHLAAGPGHTRVGIPRAGMRPHADQPQATRRAITAFLGHPLTKKDT
ncbi:alpha/beta fold hydrolase [Streptomyces sp. NPDC050121]|uniref:alpha/beta fold hydrolase n=1 Tax=Streptomyces sp. NPDC050121 TaxID=3365601 RepID=UPI00379BAC75